MSAGDGFVRRLLKRKHLPRGAAQTGAVTVAVAVDGRLAGHLIMADTLRDDAPAALSRLRQAGIERIVLASGDSRAVTEKIGGALRLDDVRAELTPAGKVDIVIAERRHGTVLMVGDGVNDAPALAAADVGISMGARGSAAAAEAADAVLLVDDLTRLAEAVEIARRARTIALQSVIIGLGLSLRRDDRCRPRLSFGRPGGVAAGGNRRGGHPQRAAGAALNGTLPT